MDLVLWCFAIAAGVLWLAIGHWLLNAERPEPLHLHGLKSLLYFLLVLPALLMVCLKVLLRKPR
jgi:hypothetical protein